MVYYEEAQRLQALLDTQEETFEAQKEELRASHLGAMRKKEGELDALRADQEKMRKQNVALDDELGRWMEENDALRDKLRALENKPQPAWEALQRSRDELS